MKEISTRFLKRIIGYFLLVLFMVVMMGCRSTPPLSEPEPTQIPPSPTPSLVFTPTLPQVTPTPEVVLDLLPSRVFRLPVTAAAMDTAADLMAAERIPVDYYLLALEVRGMTQDQLHPDLPSPDLEIGDQSELIINVDLRGTYQPIPVIVRYLTPNAVWWVSAEVEISDEQVAAAARRFEEEVIPSNRSVFGEEWLPGINNDPRVHILLVAPSGWRGFYGYFSMINQYPQSLFPNSNQREMIVLNVERVETGSSGELIREIKSLDTKDFAGQLAHEHQHLIHWNLNRNQDNWLNEALSELASFLITSTDPDSTLGVNNLEFFAQNPHIQLTNRPDRSQLFDGRVVFGHYGAEKLFAVYLSEQFGLQFIHDLVHNSTPGIAGIQQSLDNLPGDQKFNDVFANWLVANLVNQPELYSSQYGYQQITPFEPIQEIVQTFPVQTTAARLKSYGARYYKIKADQPVKVSFKGSTMARLTLLDPPSGQFVWYSNRGDETEFSLWRQFDLTHVDTATLNFKVSYDLEKDYDFGYVQVSTDGGITWEILQTEHGTAENPHGTSLGFGYTGISGNWRSESLDLSPYAGQTILLRFQVINDFTTNLFGLQLDDIEIQEIEFFDGAEDETGGWQAQGFVRSSNFVPADWIVWLATQGEKTEVERIDVSPDQAADFIIDGLGSEYSHATLIISPTAPITSLELDYELIFQYP
jgi:immune inhibitor A